MIERVRWSLLIAGACSALILVIGAEAVAEKAWVRSEIRLNIRTGPGTQFRIVGVIKTGDGVTILERGDSWTKVRLKDEEGKQKTGWIPEGYLNPEPPPTIRLQQAEKRVVTLEEQLGSLETETGKLRKSNDQLNSQDGEQQSQIKQLTMENMELRAGARYPEWITGASIFAAGMVLGAWLRHSSARRQPSRIRL